MSPQPRQVKASSRGNQASRQKIGVNPGAIKEAKPKDYAIRFLFGAAISAGAGLVGLRFGPRVGGLFLAFPAILPAALSLLEKKEGEGPADADIQGGVLGGIGMVFFALTVFAGVQLVGAPGALALGLVAWAIVAAGLYLLLRKFWSKVWG